MALFFARGQFGPIDEVVTLRSPAELAEYYRDLLLTRTPFQTARTPHRRTAEFVRSVDGVALEQPALSGWLDVQAEQLAELHQRMYEIEAEFFASTIPCEPPKLPPPIALQQGMLNGAPGLLSVERRWDSQWRFSRGHRQVGYLVSFTFQTEEELRDRRGRAYGPGRLPG